MLIKSYAPRFERPYFLPYLPYMVLEHYISELLYRYNCVMVPEFGAFLTQMKSSVHIQDSNTFYPPKKQISFNEQVSSNDGLLIAYISNTEKLSYEEALIKVTQIAKEWKITLQKGGRLELRNIGELWLNSDQKLQFQPYDKINYSTSSFGLSSLVSAPVTREVLKEEVIALEEKIPFVFTPEKREATSIRPYLKYAAIFLLVVSTSLTGFRFYTENANKQQLVIEEVQEQVSKRIQEATFFDTAPMELPTLSLDVISAPKKKIGRLHHIVAGAFRFKKNADKKMRQLKRRGYNPAYIGTNRHGLHMVTYDSYTDVDEALNALRSVKRTQSSDAWLLSTK